MNFYVNYLRKCIAPIKIIVYLSNFLKLLKDLVVKGTDYVVSILRYGYCNVIMIILLSDWQLPVHNRKG